MESAGDRAGLRMTPQRREVFEVLTAGGEHPTATEVFMAVKRRMPTISLATVYNCLEALVEGGLVKQVNVDREATRYCANLEDHVHFICTSCGRVHDVQVGDQEAWESAFRIPEGFRVEQYDVNLRGLCSDCNASYVTEN